MTLITLRKRVAAVYGRGQCREEYVGLSDDSLGQFLASPYAVITINF